MKITSGSIKDDCIVLPFWQKGGGHVEAAFVDKALAYQNVLATKDFTAQEGEVLFCYPEKGPKRLLLLGLGPDEAPSDERYRRAYAAAAKAALHKKIGKLSLYIPEGASYTAIAEGIALVNYSFDAYKKEKKELIQAIGLFKDLKKAADSFDKVFGVAEGIYQARDLINKNADEVTPLFLADFAEKLASSRVTVKVYDKPWLKKKGFGLLLAVAKGSSVDPRLIVLEYRGDPRSKENTVIVGKGVTYDTGGLNIKLESSMLDMKSDMSGAAAALGLVVALEKSGLKKNVTVVIPATENAISANSYKPGDVFTSFLGKTVEIDNTDAEGRLILADALAWANKEYKPTRLIDIATLTGGVIIAFGEELIGLMGNNQALVEDLRAASERTFERCWQLPLYDEFKDLMISSIADIKNCGEKGASSIKGGIFLKEFVGSTPWAHLDIAGTAFLDRERRYWPKGATGVGIRLLLNFLEHA